MIRLHSLGQCIIDVGDTRLTPAAETLFAAMLYLILEGSRPIARRELMEILWPRASERRVHHCLRQALYKLNAMGAGLRCERTHIVLPPQSVHTDCGVLLAAQDSRTLERLAEESTGPFLQGYAPAFSAAFNEWLDRRRDLVHSALRRVLIAGILAKRQRGEWHRAEELAVKCLIIDPLNEEATLAIAEAAAMHGSKARALDILDCYLREIGPEAREIRVPALVLRRRIADVRPDYAPAVRRVPHIGRTEEMAQLMRVLHLARSGHGGTLVVWGEPGIGKSRLVTEFTRAAELHRVQCARVACHSYSAYRPLSALITLAPKLLALRGAIGASPEALMCLRRLTAHDSCEIPPPPEDRASDHRTPRLRRAVLDVLDALSAEAPVVVIIEDVHWLDQDSWELLCDIVPWAHTRRVIVLLTTQRSDVIARLPIGAHLAPGLVHLRSLPEASSRELVQCLTAGTKQEGDAHFLDWCVAVGGGNPHFLTELALHATWDGAQFRAPAAIGELVRDRLARLTPPSLRVLQACSVLGEFATLGRLERVLDEKRLALLTALDELEQIGLVTSDGSRIRCMHPLLASAAFAELSTLSRALLHRHAALALEHECADGHSPATASECARHWQQAGEPQRAVMLHASAPLPARRPTDGEMSQENRR